MMILAENTGQSGDEYARTYSDYEEDYSQYPENIVEALNKPNMHGNLEVYRGQVR